MTKYNILRDIGGNNQWQLEASDVEARNAAHAIQQFGSMADLVNAGTNTYVAVPARGWRPMVMETKTSTTLRVKQLELVP